MRPAVVFKVPVRVVVDIFQTPYRVVIQTIFYFAVLVIFRRRIRFAGEFFSFVEVGGENNILFARPFRPQRSPPKRQKRADVFVFFSLAIGGDLFRRRAFRIFDGKRVVSNVNADALQIVGGFALRQRGEKFVVA